MTRLAIYGSALGGGAGQIIEALQGQPGIRPVLILDRDPASLGKSIFEIPVVGSTNEIERLWKEKEFDAIVIAIGGDLAERKKAFDLATSFDIPVSNIIDPSIRLGLNVKMGQGNVILNGTYVGNNCSIGDNNYILNNCSFQHDTSIGNHNYFATNVIVGAKVQIGSQNRLGIKCVVETKGIVANEQVFKTGETLLCKK